MKNGLRMKIDSTGLHKKIYSLTCYRLVLGLQVLLTLILNALLTIVTLMLLTLNIEFVTKVSIISLKNFIALFNEA
jgi:hypothetical protein